MNKLPTVTAICAIGKRGQLGLNGKLPWHDSDDLKRFKRLTKGHLLISGFNTFHGLPRFGDRLIFVPDRNDSPEFTLMTIGAATDETNVFLIGGGKTFKQFAEAGLIRHWDITKVDYDGPADTWFDPTWLTMGK